MINNRVGAYFTVVSYTRDDEGSISRTDLSDVEFNNAGTLDCAAEVDGGAFIGVQFNNTGSVDLQEGFLTLGGDGASISTGSFTGDVGTALELDVQFLTPESAVCTAGTLRFVTCIVGGSLSATGSTYAANTNFTGPVLDVGSSLEINALVSFAPASGGSVQLSAGAITVDSGGNLGGADSFDVGGMLTLNNGAELSMQGVVSADGGLEIAGNNQIHATTLVNNGTANWGLNGAGSIFLFDGASIINNDHATFTAVGTPGGLNSSICARRHFRCLVSERG